MIYEELEGIEEELMKSCKIEVLGQEVSTHDFKKCRHMKTDLNLGMKC